MVNRNLSVTTTQPARPPCTTWRWTKRKNTCWQLARTGTCACTACTAENTPKPSKAAPETTVRSSKWFWIGLEFIWPPLARIKVYRCTIITQESVWLLCAGTANWPPVWDLLMIVGSWLVPVEMGEWERRLNQTLKKNVSGYLNFLSILLSADWIITKLFSQLYLCLDGTARYGDYNADETEPAGDTSRENAGHGVV